MDERPRLKRGGCFVRSRKSGKILGDELGDWAIWSVVEQSSKHIGIEHFGAHDLRRTCAKFCRKSGGDLEQIKFLLGHASIQTTERYLGSEQEIVGAVNDNLAAKPLYKGLGFTVKESDAAQAAKINLKTLAYFSASEK